MANSIVVGHKLSAGHLHMMKPCSRFSWNPISQFKDEIWRSNKTLIVQQYCVTKIKRKSFAVYASGGVPGAPLPSAPPPSSSIKSWIVGFVVSIILPFFTHKWGPLWILKNRIDIAVQRVEDIVEAVEKVAEEVDKIAENMADDLPEGKLKNLVEFVEDMAEKTAKTADSLDNIIDKVQEAEDQVENIVESIAKEAKNSPKQAKAVAEPHPVRAGAIAPRNSLKKKLDE
ncbi:hypothetical protein ACJIZ3_002956 [Penstemon smallii]|uniref:Uncharacterized protein n=1 Tax=Penstemon smallii TaxID=265156 RepID=A0ABD3UBM6_9LAMI